MKHPHPNQEKTSTENKTEKCVICNTTSETVEFKGKHICKDCLKAVFSM